MQPQGYILLLTFLLSATFIKNAESLQCYNCSDSWTCNDKYVVNNSSSLVDCPAATACKKTVLVGLFNGVNRECVSNCSETTRFEFGYIKLDYCCYKDQCNHSARLMLSSSLMFLSLSVLSFLSGLVVFF